MTPEEKFERDIGWVLSMIKGEHLSTTSSANVEVDTVRSANRDSDSPAVDSIAKCFRKLEEWGAFRVIEKHDSNDFSIGIEATSWNRATYFVLAINQPTFDKLYAKYERGIEIREKEEPIPGQRHQSFDWEMLSRENLQVAQTVINITLNAIELNGINRMWGNRILLQKFENEQVYFDDVAGVLGRVDGVEVKNAVLSYQRKEFERSRVVVPGTTTNYGFLDDIFISEDDLRRYVFLLIDSLDELQRVKSTIDRKLKNILERPSETNAVSPSDLESEKRIPRFKSGTQWKHFIFRFIDTERLTVTVGNGNKIEVELDFNDLSCDDKRKTSQYPKYDSKWKLLLQLSQVNGEIVPRGRFFDEANEKAKQALTQKLQNYFHISEDPFWPVDAHFETKRKGSYKFRADLVPPPPEISCEEIQADELSSEINQFYKEQTPGIGES